MDSLLVLIIAMSVILIKLIPSNSVPEIWRIINPRAITINGTIIIFMRSFFVTVSFPEILGSIYICISARLFNLTRVCEDIVCSFVKGICYSKCFRQEVLHFVLLSGATQFAYFVCHPLWQYAINTA